MTAILGAILIIMGLGLILLKLLIVWGLVKAPAGAGPTLGRGGAGAFDFLILLLDKAGWLVTLGLILVVAGLLLLGIEFPSLS